jgi:hypothetical protein
LLEQESVAQKLRTWRAVKPEKIEQAAGKVDGILDKALEDSFPGSDPVSFLEAGPVKEGDLPLATMKGQKRRDPLTDGGPTYRFLSVDPASIVATSSRALSARAGRVHDKFQYASAMTPTERA